MAMSERPRRPSSLALSTVCHPLGPGMASSGNESGVGTERRHEDDVGGGDDGGGCIQRGVGRETEGNGHKSVGEGEKDEDVVGGDDDCQRWLRLLDGLRAGPTQQAEEDGKRSPYTRRETTHSRHTVYGCLRKSSAVTSLRYLVSFGETAHDKKEKQRALAAVQCLSNLHQDTGGDCQTPQSNMTPLLYGGDLHCLIKYLLLADDAQCVLTAAMILEWMTLARFLLNIQDGWVELRRSVDMVGVAMNKGRGQLQAVNSAMRRLWASTVAMLIASPGDHDVHQDLMTSSHHGRTLQVTCWLTLFDLCPSCDLHTWVNLCRAIYILGKSDIAQFPGLGTRDEIAVRWALYHCHSGRMEKALQRSAMAAIISLFVRKDHLVNTMIEKEATIPVLTQFIVGYDNDQLPANNTNNTRDCDDGAGEGEMSVEECGVRAIAALCERRAQQVAGRLDGSLCCRTDLLPHALVNIVLSQDTRPSIRKDGAFTLYNFVRNGVAQSLIRDNFSSFAATILKSKDTTLGSMLLLCVFHVQHVLNAQEVEQCHSLLAVLTSQPANRHTALCLTSNLLLDRQAVVTEVQGKEMMGSVWSTMGSERPEETTRDPPLLLDCLRLLNAVLTVIRGDHTFRHYRHLYTAVHQQSHADSARQLEQLVLASDTPRLARRKTASIIYWMVTGYEGVGWWYGRGGGPVVTLMESFMESEDCTVCLIGLTILCHLLAGLLPRDPMVTTRHSHLHQLVKAIGFRTRDPLTLKIVSFVLHLSRHYPSCHPADVNTINDVITDRDDDNAACELIGQCQERFRERPLDICIDRTRLDAWGKPSFNISAKQIEDSERLSRHRLSQQISVLQIEDGLSKQIRSASTKRNDNFPGSENNTYLDFGFKVICKSCLLSSSRKHFMDYTYKKVTFPKMMRSLLASTFGLSALQERHGSVFKHLSDLVKQQLMKKDYRTVRPRSSQDSGKKVERKILSVHGEPQKQKSLRWEAQEQMTERVNPQKQKNLNERGEPQKQKSVKEAGGPQEQKNLKKCGEPQDLKNLKRGGEHQEQKTFKKGAESQEQKNLKKRGEPQDQKNFKKGGEPEEQKNLKQAGESQEQKNLKEGGEPKAQKNLHEGGEPQEQKNLKEDGEHREQKNLNEAGEPLEQKSRRERVKSHEAGSVALPPEDTSHLTGDDYEEEQYDDDEDNSMNSPPSPPPPPPQSPFEADDEYWNQVLNSSQNNVGSDATIRYQRRQHGYAHYDTHSGSGYGFNGGMTVRAEEAGFSHVRSIRYEVINIHTKDCNVNQSTIADQQAQSQDLSRQATTIHEDTGTVQSSETKPDHSADFLLKQGDRFLQEWSIHNEQCHVDPATNRHIEEVKNVFQQVDLHEDVTSDSDRLSQSSGIDPLSQLSVNIRLLQTRLQQLAERTPQSHIHSDDSDHEDDEEDDDEDVSSRPQKLYHSPPPLTIRNDVSPQRRERLTTSNNSTNHHHHTPPPSGQDSFESDLAEYDPSVQHDNDTSVETDEELLVEKVEQSGEESAVVEEVVDKNLSDQTVGDLAVKDEKRISAGNVHDEGIMHESDQKTVHEFEDGRQPRCDSKGINEVNDSMAVQNYQRGRQCLHENDNEADQEMCRRLNNKESGLFHEDHHEEDHKEFPELSGGRTTHFHEGISETGHVTNVESKRESTGRLQVDVGQTDHQSTQEVEVVESTSHHEVIGELKMKKRVRELEAGGLGSLETGITEKDQNAQYSSSSNVYGNVIVTESSETDEEFQSPIISGFFHENVSDTDLETDQELQIHGRMYVCENVSETDLETSSSSSCGGEGRPQAEGAGRCQDGLSAERSGSSLVYIDGSLLGESESQCWTVPTEDPSDDDVFLSSLESRCYLGGISFVRTSLLSQPDKLSSDVSQSPQHTNQLDHQLSDVSQSPQLLSQPDHQPSDVSQSPQHINQHDLQQSDVSQSLQPTSVIEPIQPSSSTGQTDHQTFEIAGQPSVFSQHIEAVSQCVQSAVSSKKLLDMTQSAVSSQQLDTDSCIQSAVVSGSVQAVMAHSVFLQYTGTTHPDQTGTPGNTTTQHETPIASPASETASPTSSVTTFPHKSVHIHHSSSSQRSTGNSSSNSMVSEIQQHQQPPPPHAHDDRARLTYKQVFPDEHTASSTRSLSISPQECYDPFNVNSISRTDQPPLDVLQTQPSRFREEAFQPQSDSDYSQLDRNKQWPYDMSAHGEVAVLHEDMTKQHISVTYDSETLGPSAQPLQLLNIHKEKSDTRRLSEELITAAIQETVSEFLEVQAVSPELLAEKTVTGLKSEHVSDRTERRSQTVSETELRTHVVSDVEHKTHNESETDWTPHNVPDSREKIPQNVSDSREKIQQEVSDSGEKIQQNVQESGEKIQQNVSDSGEKIQQNDPYSRETIQQNVPESGEKIQQNVSDSGEKIPQNVSDLGEKMQQNVSDKGEKMQQNVSDSVEHMPQNMTDSGEKIPQNMTDSGEKIPHNVSDAGEKIPQNVSDSGDDMPQNVLKPQFVSGKEQVRQETVSLKEQVRQETVSGKEQVRQETVSGKEQVKLETVSDKGMESQVLSQTLSEKEELGPLTMSEKERKPQIVSCKDLRSQTVVDQKIEPQTVSEKEQAKPETVSDKEKLSPQTVSDKEKLSPQTVSDKELRIQLVTDQKLTPQTVMDKAISQTAERGVQEQESHKIPDTLQQVPQQQVSEWFDSQTLESQLAECLPDIICAVLQNVGDPEMHDQIHDSAKLLDSERQECSSVSYPENIHFEKNNTCPVAVSDTRLESVYHQSINVPRSPESEDKDQISFVQLRHSEENASVIENHLFQTHFRSTVLEQDDVVYEKEETTQPKPCIPHDIDIERVDLHCCCPTGTERITLHNRSQPDIEKVSLQSSSQADIERVNMQSISEADTERVRGSDEVVCQRTPGVSQTTSFNDAKSPPKSVKSLHHLTSLDDADDVMCRHSGPCDIDTCWIANDEDSLSAGCEESMTVVLQVGDDTLEEIIQAMQEDDEDDDDEEEDLSDTQPNDYLNMFQEVQHIEHGLVHPADSERHLTPSLFPGKCRTEIPEPAERDEVNILSVDVQCDGGEGIQSLESHREHIETVKFDREGSGGNVQSPECHRDHVEIVKSDRDVAVCLESAKDFVERDVPCCASTPEISFAQPEKQGLELHFPNNRDESTVREENDPLASEVLTQHMQCIGVVETPPIDMPQQSQDVGMANTLPTDMSFQSQSMGMVITDSILLTDVSLQSQDVNVVKSLPIGMSHKNEDVGVVKTDSNLLPEMSIEPHDLGVVKILPLDASRKNQNVGVVETDVILFPGLSCQYQDMGVVKKDVNLFRGVSHKPQDVGGVKNLISDISNKRKDVGVVEKDEVPSEELLCQCTEDAQRKLNHPTDDSSRQPIKTVGVSQTDVVPPSAINDTCQYEARIQKDTTSPIETSRQSMNTVGVSASNVALPSQFSFYPHGSAVDTTNLSKAVHLEEVDNVTGYSTSVFHTEGSTDGFKSADVEVDVSKYGSSVDLTVDTTKYSSSVDIPVYEAERLSGRSMSKDQTKDSTRYHTISINTKVDAQKGSTSVDPEDDATFRHYDTIDRSEDSTMRQIPADSTADTTKCSQEAGTKKCSQEADTTKCNQDADTTKCNQDADAMTCSHETNAAEHVTLPSTTLVETMKRRRSGEAVITAENCSISVDPEKPETTKTTTETVVLTTKSSTSDETKQPADSDKEKVSLHSVATPVDNKSSARKKTKIPVSSPCHETRRKSHGDFDIKTQPFFSSLEGFQHTTGQQGTCTHKHRKRSQGTATHHLRKQSAEKKTAASDLEYYDMSTEKSETGSASPSRGLVYPHVSKTPRYSVNRRAAWSSDNMYTFKSLSSSTSSGILGTPKSDSSTSKTPHTPRSYSSFSKNVGTMHRSYSSSLGILNTLKLSESAESNVAKEPVPKNRREVFTECEPQTGLSKVDNADNTVQKVASTRSIQPFDETNELERQKSGQRQSPSNLRRKSKGEGKTRTSTKRQSDIQENPKKRIKLSQPPKTNTGRVREVLSLATQIYNKYKLLAKKPKEIEEEKEEKANGLQSDANQEHKSSVNVESSVKKWLKENDVSLVSVSQQPEISQYSHLHPMSTSMSLPDLHQSQGRKRSNTKHDLQKQLLPSDAPFSSNTTQNADFHCHDIDQVSRSITVDDLHNESSLDPVSDTGHDLHLYAHMTSDVINPCDKGMMSRCQTHQKKRRSAEIASVKYPSTQPGTRPVTPKRKASSLPNTPLQKREGKTTTMILQSHEEGDTPPTNESASQKNSQPKTCGNSGIVKAKRHITVRHNFTGGEPIKYSGAEPKMSKTLSFGRITRQKNPRDKHYCEEKWSSTASETESMSSPTNSDVQGEAKIASGKPETQIAAEKPEKSISPLQRLRLVFKNSSRKKCQALSPALHQADKLTGKKIGTELQTSQKLEKDFGAEREDVADMASCGNLKVEGATPQDKPETKRGIDEKRQQRRSQDRRDSRSHKSWRSQRKETTRNNSRSSLQKNLKKAKENDTKFEERARPEGKIEESPSYKETKPGSKERECKSQSNEAVKKIPEHDIYRRIKENAKKIQDSKKGNHPNEQETGEAIPDSWKGIQATWEATQEKMERIFQDTKEINPERESDSFETRKTIEGDQETREKVQKNRSQKISKEENQKTKKRIHETSTEALEIKKRDLETDREIPENVRKQPDQGDGEAETRDQGETELEINRRDRKYVSQESTENAQENECQGEQATRVKVDKAIQKNEGLDPETAKEDQEREQETDKGVQKSREERVRDTGKRVEEERAQESGKVVQQENKEGSKVQSPMTAWKQKLLDCLRSEERKRSEEEMPFLVPLSELLSRNKQQPPTAVDPQGLSRQSSEQSVVKNDHSHHQQHHQQQQDMQQLSAGHGLTNVDVPAAGISNEARNSGKASKKPSLSAPKKKMLPVKPSPRLGDRGQHTPSPLSRETTSEQEKHEEKHLGVTPPEELFIPENDKSAQMEKRIKSTDPVRGHKQSGAAATSKPKKVTSHPQKLAGKGKSSSAHGTRITTGSSKNKKKSPAGASRDVRPHQPSEDSSQTERHDLAAASDEPDPRVTTSATGAGTPGSSVSVPKEGRSRDGGTLLGKLWKGKQSGSKK